jgi:hypothetical protein
MIRRICSLLPIVQQNHNALNFRKIRSLHLPEQRLAETVWRLDREVRNKTVSAIDTVPNFVAHFLLIPRGRRTCHLFNSITQVSDALKRIRMIQPYPLPDPKLLVASFFAAMSTVVGGIDFL